MSYSKVQDSPMSPSDVDEQTTFISSSSSQQKQNEEQEEDREGGMTTKNKKIDNTKTQRHEEEEEKASHQHRGQCQQQPPHEAIPRSALTMTTTPTTTAFQDIFTRLIIPVHLPNVCLGTATGILFPVIPVFARGTLAASDATIGFIFSALGIGKVVFDVPSGVFTHRYGVKTVMIWGIFIFLVGTVLSALALASMVLWLASFVWGAGTALFFLARHRMLADIVVPERRGRLMSILGGGQRWAMVLGPAIGGFITEIWGCRVALLMQAPLVVVILFCLFNSEVLQEADSQSRDAVCHSNEGKGNRKEEETEGDDVLMRAPRSETNTIPTIAIIISQKNGSVVPSTTDEHIKEDVLDDGDHSEVENQDDLLLTDFGADNEKEEKTEKKNQKTEGGASSPQSPPSDVSFLHHFYSILPLVKQHRDMLIRLGVYSSILVALRNCRRFLLPLAALNLQLSPSLVGLLVTVSFFVDSILFFLGGHLMDTYGRKYAAIPVASGLGLSFFALGFFSRSTVSLFFVAVLFGLTDACGAGLLLTLIADHTAQHGAKVMSILRLTQDMGQMIGPVFAGLLIHYLSFRVACMTLGVLGFFAAAWAAYLLPETLKAAANKITDRATEC